MVGTNLIKEERDLGIIIQDKISPEKHTDMVSGGTCRLLMNIKVTINYMDKEMLRELIVLWFGHCARENILGN